MRRRQNKTIWKLTKRTGRKNWVVRFRLAGRVAWREETTGKRRKRDAETAARAIINRAEAEGDCELYGWWEFRQRYESEHLSGKAAKTLEAFVTAANRLDELCKPEMVSDVSADMLSRFALRLRQELKSESTIQAYRDHLLSALKWAKQVGLIDERPEPPPLGRVAKTPKARGRQISREEAERMVMQLPEIVGKSCAKRWAWNLEALWRSGLRIGETFQLYWQPEAGKHYVEGLDEPRPRIVIDASHEKGRRDRKIPITPDFVALLRSVPTNRRRGLVFRWTGQKGSDVTKKTVEKRIARAGELAGVVIDQREVLGEDGKPETVPVYASAHAFRKAFGSRWAMKVMPLVLKEMMRHASISTTERYYVGQNADRIGDVLWSVQDADLGDMLDALFESDHESAYEKKVKAERTGLQPATGKAST